MKKICAHSGHERAAPNRTKSHQDHTMSSLPPTVETRYRRPRTPRCLPVKARQSRSNLLAGRGEKGENRWISLWCNGLPMPMRERRSKPVKPGQKLKSKPDRSCTTQIVTAVFSTPGGSIRTPPERQSMRKIGRSGGCVKMQPAPGCGGKSAFSIRVDRVSLTAVVF